MVHENMNVVYSVAHSARAAAALLRELDVVEEVLAGDLSQGLSLTHCLKSDKVLRYALELFSACAPPPLLRTL